MRKSAPFTPPPSAPTTPFPAESLASANPPFASGTSFARSTGEPPVPLFRLARVGAFALGTAALAFVGVAAPALVAAENEPAARPQPAATATASTNAAPTAATASTNAAPTAATASTNAAPNSNATGTANATVAAAVPAIPPVLRVVETSAWWRVPTDMRRGGSGRFSSITSGGEIGLSLNDAQGREPPANVLYTAFQYERADFNFADTARWFGDASRYGVTLHYERRLNRYVSALFNGGAHLAAEDGAHWGDSLGGRIGAGVRFTWRNRRTGRERFTAFTGAMVASRYSAEARWLPFAGVNFNISPNWNLRTTDGIYLTYDVFGDTRGARDDKLLLQLGARYAGVNFRLREAESGPRQRRALTGREGMLVFSVTQEFLNRAGYVTVRAGGTFLSKYKIVSSGHNLGHFHCDPAAVLGLEAGLRF